MELEKLVLQVSTGLALEISWQSEIVKRFSDAKVFVFGLGSQIVALCWIRGVKSVFDRIWNKESKEVWELFCSAATVLVCDPILVTRYKSKTAERTACDITLIRGSVSKLSFITPFEHVSPATSLRFHLINLTVFRVLYYCVSLLILILFRNPLTFWWTPYYSLCLTLHFILCDVIP